MFKSKLFSDSIKNGDGNTYINGLGFVDASKARAIFFSIRRNSNIMCLFTFLYFIVKQAFFVPCTYLVYFFGGNIKINFYTGLILYESAEKELILFLASIIALVFSSIACFIANGKTIVSAKIFRAPYKGLNSISIFITCAIGVLGLSISSLFENFFKMTGIIFYSESLSAFSSTSIKSLTFLLILALMQEIFFRGIMLTPLRQFGDGFAIISSSLLFALWNGGVYEFIFTFIVSLALCYFTIRSGSIYTAIISRISFEVLKYILGICKVSFDKTTSYIAVTLLSILFIALGILFLIRFIKADEKAFYLTPPSDKLNIGVKTSIFASSLIFIIFLTFRIIYIIQTTQIIG